MATNIFLGYPPENIKNWIIENYGPKEDPMLKVPLHFVAEEPDVILKFNIDEGEYEYSFTNEDNTWLKYENSTPITLENVGDKVYFRASNDKGNINGSLDSYFETQPYNKIVKISAHGNIMSLIDKTMTAVHVPTDGLNRTFSYLKGLLTAPLLPATSLGSHAYNFMFKDCKSLTKAPVLPATTLAIYCYSEMFSGCTALTKPEFKMSNLTFDEVANAIRNDYIIGGDYDYYETEPTFTYEIQCSDKTMIATPAYDYYEDDGYYVTGWTLEEKK